MEVTWKLYNIEEWEHGVAGCSPSRRPLGRFVFNKSRVCINSNVLGLVGKGWRIGILTARRPDGRWVAGEDISFLSAGAGYYPELDTCENFPEEKDAQRMQLQRVALWVERYANPEYISCPIPRNQANLALRLISEKLTEINGPRLPIYTQLSLF